MPSGYQQNINQLDPTFYRVVITQSGGTATWTTAGQTAGGVNPYDWNAYNVAPSSLVAATTLAQGNIRWQSIVEELCKLADARIYDMTVTFSGGSAGDFGSVTTNANTAITSLAFDVAYDRDANVLQGYQKILLAENASNTTYVGYGGGSNFVNTTAKAVRELVTRGTIRGTTSGWYKNYRVYNPGTVEELQSRVFIQQPDTAVNIWTDIAVTQVADTLTGV
jgi:hypothetical protein